MSSCSIIPQVRNKKGELVDSKLFTDLLSLMNREQAKNAYLSTRTLEFKNWFGDWEKDPFGSSKVVDENGEPLMVYHGSKSNSLDTFKPSLSDRGVVRDTYFFTPISSYAKEYGTSIYPVFLNIKNIEELDRTKEIYELNYGTARKSKEKGFDGAVGIDDASEIPTGNKLDAYVVFNANQIKSIYNEGKFDTKENNIYLQKNAQEQTRANTILDERLTGFLNTIGVTLKSVKNIKDSAGNKIDANAMANLLHKSIEIVEGSAKLDTLPEEASHFFVEMLKQNNSPLYNSMKSEIGNYQIYKDTVQDYNEVYKGNQDKIADEAIAKLIASHIVNNFQEEDRKGRASRWFNKVIDFIKSKLLLLHKREVESAIIQNNPFSEAASLILDRNPINFSYDENYNIENDMKYFQLTSSLNIENRIRDKFDVSLGTNGKYQINEDGVIREIKNRVSDKVNEKYKYKQDSVKAQYGIKGNNDITNIINRVVAERDGKLSPSRVIETNEEVYNKLESSIRQMISTLPSDAKILTQQIIYDPKSDTASTVGTLVIYPDGKVDIIKFAFIDFDSRKKKSIFAGEEKAFNERLVAQKQILAKSYGITNFGKIRTIPIETKYDSITKSLNSIRTGNQDSIDNLEQIPISEEMTGDEKLDRIIAKLLKDKTEWENKRIPYESKPEELREFNERKYAQLSKINRAIKDIQLRHDVKQFVDIGLSTINELASTPINSYTQERLLDLQKTMQFYGKDMLSLVQEQIKDLSDIQKADFNRLVTESQLYDNNIKAEIARRLIEVNGDDLLEPQKETGIWSRIMQTVSQQNHPIIKAFWGLVKNSKSKTREQVIELNKQIQSAIQGVRTAQPGVNGVDLFNFMLDKKANGQLSITSKYDSEFIKKLNNAREKLKSGTIAEKNSSIEFMKNNTVFDKEAYEKAELEQANFLKEFYKNDVDADEKYSDRLFAFRNKYSNNENGYSNQSNPYIKIKDDLKLQSERYKNIQSKPELKAFYDLWMTNSKNFQDYIGKDLGKNFVWNVHNGLVDSLAENGFGAFTNMNSILDHLEARAGESLGMIDPETGKPLYEIPSYYTDINRKYNEETKQWEVDSSNQSRDLGKVLSLVGNMAYNHKYMQEIEDSTKSLNLLLQDQQTVLTNNNGETITNKLTNQIAKVVGSADTLQQFQDYMNYYVYGVRSKTKDFVVKIGERNFSSLALYNSTSKWFIGKALALNPQSIVSNIVGGNANIRIIAAMDKYFNNSQFNKAIYNLLPFRDKKAFSLLGYFDLVDGQNHRKSAESLSVNALSRILTYDHLLIGQESGDKVIRSSVLLAMLQSHTYKDGKIIKSLEGDTSLYDHIDATKENLDFNGISKDTLDTFRTKVLAVTDNVLGNNTRDDIRLAQLTVMGRAMMAFRSWIPRMVDTRYADLKHNSELDTYELGRYRTFWNQIVNKQFLPLLYDSIKGFGFFGYGGKFGDRTINRAKELYAAYMEKNPMASITEQEYINLHLSNMKGNMMEAYVTAIMLTAIMAAKPDDGEKAEQGSLRKWFVMQMERNISELMFFYSPSQFSKIIKSPLPIINTFNDMINFGKAYAHGTEELVTGQQVAGTKDNEFRSANFKVIPGLAGFESILSFIQDDYNTSASIGTDSKNR